MDNLESTQSGGDCWSELHPDLLHEVAKRVDCYDDYVRLRAVCKIWNSNLPKFPKHIKNLWIAFLYAAGNPFYSIGEEKVYSFELPEMRNTVIKGSYDGWLVIVGVDGEVQLLNPFTKDQISLPPLSTSPDVIAYRPEKHDKEYKLRGRLHQERKNYHTVSKSFMQKFHIWKAIISSQPRFMVMIIYGISGKLAYCKLGDKKWRVIPETDQLFRYRDAVFHGGKVYAINEGVEFCKIDIELRQVIKVQAPVSIRQDFDFTRNFLYVVGVPGGYIRRNFLYVVGTPNGVIMVIRRVNWHPDYKYGKTYGFDIYNRLDEGGEWSRVNNLGDYVLMLGYNSSECLLPHAFPDKKGNRIYYTDDLLQYHYSKPFTGYDVGCFNLENGTTHQLFPASLLASINSDASPPAPIWFLYRAI